MKQARAGSLLIGGGWPARTDPVTGYPRVDLRSLRANLAVALRVAPSIGDVLVIRSWAGIGTGTPDERPVIGRLPGVPRVLVGLFPYLGLTAGPLMGRVLAALILGRDPGLDIGAVPGRPVFEPLRRALDGGHTYRCRAYFVKRHQTMSARYVCDMRTIARLTNDLPQRRVRPDPGGPVVAAASRGARRHADRADDRSAPGQVIIRGLRPPAHDRSALDGEDTERGSK